MNGDLSARCNACPRLKVKNLHHEANSSRFKLKQKLFVETHFGWFLTHDIIKFYDVFMRCKWQRIAESRTCLTFDNSHKTRRLPRVDVIRLQLFMLNIRFCRSLITKNNWLNSNKRSLKDVSEA